MKHKLIMGIAAAAALLVIVTAATLPAFPRSVPNAGLIPVTGPSNSGGSPVNNIARQIPAAVNSKVTHTGESPEEEYVFSQQYHPSASSNVSHTGESPEEEYILNHQYKLNDAPGQPAIQVTGELCPFTAQEIESLHTVYFKDINVRMLETKDGPIGYDGGLIALSQCRISK